MIRFKIWGKSFEMGMGQINFLHYQDEGINFLHYQVEIRENYTPIVKPGSQDKTIARPKRDSQ